MSSAVSGDPDRSGAAVDGGDRGRRWGLQPGQVGEQGVVGLAGDVALEAAHDFGLRLAFGGAAFRVGAGALAVAQTADDDQVQRSVRLAIAAVVEAVAGALAGGGGDRARAAESGERPLPAQPLDVLSSGDQKPTGVAGRGRRSLRRARRSAERWSAARTSRRGPVGKARRSMGAAGDTARPCRGSSCERRAGRGALVGR